MTQALIAAGLAAALIGVSPALAMTESECTTAWNKADSNKDGTLTDAEGARYFAALHRANTPVPEGKLTKSAFIDHCMAGTFATVTAAD